MNFISKKAYTLILCLGAVFYSFSQNPDFKHLEVRFLKIEQPYTNYSVNSANQGYFKKKDSKTKIKVNLTNKGKTPINLNLNNVYVLDRANNMHPVKYLSPVASKKKTIKPNKSLKQTIYFELPQNHQPVILIIEDWKFPLYE